MSSTGPTSLGAIVHYNLLERLEPAGPGDRFRARDTRLGRTVDVRLMPPDFAAGPEARDRVRDEVQRAKALSHPNVVALFDAGEHEGRLYFVFELPRAQPVRQEMGGRPLAPRRAIAIGVQVADAIAEAHGRDIFHGAFQLDSILITDKDQVKVAGFGLPSLRDYDRGDGTGAAIEPADERTDIHALGGVLYELVTGRRPAIDARPNARPTVPRELNPQSSPEVDDVILRALAASPASRYQTAVTMGAELRAVAAMLEVREQAGGVPPGVNVAKVLLLSATMLAILAAIAWWVLR